MKSLAIFASGSGTNAAAIMDYFHGHKMVSVVHIYCNKTDAGVIEKAQHRKVSYTVFDKNDLYNNGMIQESLKEREIDYIALAGFLWLMPSDIISTYKGKMVNIHPALLPSYGGKGMYGMHVHEAVLEAGEKESGITIHLVNEEYDTGGILFQARLFVGPQMSAGKLAMGIHRLEHYYYPRFLEKFIIS
jgi:phosphoribosylglycinamide formyltransferase 1